jgi:ParB-like chromosome segregation protein Spo0J
MSSGGVITLGFVVTDSESKKPLLPEDQFLIFSGLSKKALKQYEKNGFVKPVRQSEGTNYYAEESADLVKAMMMCLGRCANLQEAYKMAVQGLSSKERRRDKGESAEVKTIDPREIEMHLKFKGLLDIDDDLSESLTVDMTVSGFYVSKAIVLGTWPGLGKLVLIDGHTRVRSAIKAGLEAVPYTIETFDNEEEALEYIAKVQTNRRPNNDWVRFQLVRELDTLMERGGDRRSEQAKSKGSREPIEKEYSSSAAKTGALVGWSASTVKRARRVDREGTPEILEDLKKGKIRIGQAEKRIAPRANDKATAKSSSRENQDAMVQLTDENLSGLNELGGNRHAHVNEAVKQYIEREIRKRASSDQEDSDSDKLKPRIIQ